MSRFFAWMGIAVVLAGCTKMGSSGEGSAQRNAWTRPGELRISLYTTPTSLNPILPNNTAENFVAGLAFDLLVSVDPQGHQVPVLAARVPTLENGGISKDGLTITYKLRHNVVWHDGAPFTSKDVAFTWAAVMNTSNNVVSRRGYDLVARIETPDAYTAVFHMKRTFAPAVNSIFAESDTPYRILPAHLLAKYPSLNQVPFNAKPIGTGPFKLVRWVRGDRLEYVRNDHYFLGKPKLQRIVVHFVPDESTEVNEMRSHEIDWMFESGAIPAHALANLAGTHVELPRINAYSAVLFNLARPEVGEHAVREAIALAIDKQRVVQRYQYGTADVATGDIPAFSWAYDPGIKRYAYDPAQARTVLEKAGWKVGAGGIRVKASRRLSLVLVYPTVSTFARIYGVDLQAALKAIGIDLQLKGYDAALLYSAYNQGGILQNGRFDLALYSWIAGSDPDNSSQFTCDFIPPRGNNIMHYCNREVVDAAERTALERFDIASRKAAYSKVERQMALDLPAVFLFWPRQRQPVNNDFKGFAPNGVSEGWNAYQWSI